MRSHIILYIVSISNSLHTSVVDGGAAVSAAAAAAWMPVNHRRYCNTETIATYSHR